MRKLIMPDFDTIRIMVLNISYEKTEVSERRLGFKSIPAMSAEPKRILRDINLFLASDLHDRILGESVPIIEPEEAHGVT